MNKFVFKQMEQQDVLIYVKEMFDILAGNMEKIAPTGNTYDEIYKIWSESNIPVYSEGKQKVILIFDDSSDNKLCGYFQYSLTDTTFRMEEIQFRQEYQGSGLFKELYQYIVAVIPKETEYVEASAHKTNSKSQGILKYLGLQEIGESKNGNMICFRGEYKNILERYGSKAI